MLSNKVKTILKALQGHLNFRIGCLLIHFGLLSERNEETIPAGYGWKDRY
jgi:hypothetical protein